MLQIRGKRKRKDSSKEQPSRLIKGRSFKPKTQLASSRKAALQQYALRAQRSLPGKAGRQLSTLETLPIELIHSIFFHALEVNMPRAAYSLGLALSNERIYTALLLFAYFDDDGVSLVEDKHFLPASYRVIDVEEKTSLQQGILSCRWFTYERLVDCLPVLKRLTTVQAWSREWAEQKLLLGLESDTTSLVDSMTGHNRVVLPDIDDASAIDRYFMIPDYHDLPCIQTWRLSLQEGTLSRTRHARVSILAARVIPVSVLENEWTFENLALLRILWLGYTYTYDDQMIDVSVKAILVGLKNAIQEEHVKALTILLHIHSVLCSNPANVLSSDWTLSLYHHIPIELFHLAVEKSHASNILSLLIRRSLCSLPRDDEVITRWALKESHQGNKLADWLLKHFEGTDYSEVSDRNLFTDGRPSTNVSENTRRHLPFPDRSFSDELGLTD